MTATPDDLAEQGGWREPLQPRTLDVASLRGLAHPLRIALLDTLSVYGPNTASGLADRLDESSGATSYHLRQLERHGFVREVEDRGTGRERWWERVPRPIRLPDADTFGGSDSAARAAADLIGNEWADSRHRLMMDFAAHGNERLGPEWTEPAELSTMSFQLSVDEFQELSARVTRAVFGIAEEYRGRTTPGARPVQLHLNLFPIAEPGDVTPQNHAHTASHEEDAP